MHNLKTFIPTTCLLLLVGFGKSYAIDQENQAPSCNGQNEWLLINGNILTMNTTNQTVNSIHIRGNRIVTTHVSPPQQTCAPVIDLKGKTVIPGLIDSHLHFVRQGQVPGHDIRLAESAISVKSLLATLKNASTHLPKGELLSVIGGISPSQFDENRLPTIKELDTALPNNPVYIQIGFAGPAITNSQGRILFEKHQIKVKQNGIFQKGKETNQAYAALKSRVKMSDKVRGIKRLMAHANSLGLTTVFDVGGTSFPGASYFDPTKDDEGLQKVHKDKQMTLRVRLQHSNTQKINQAGKFEKAIEGMPPLTGDSMLRYTATGEHIVSFPEKGKVNPFYQNRVATVAIHRWSHEQHSVSDQENRQHLAMIQKVHQKSPIHQLRWSLSHVFELGMPGTEDQLALLKKMKMGLRVQNHGYHTKTDVFPLGRNLKGKNSGPLYRTLLDENIPLGAGSDGALLGPMNPWFSIYYMVTGKNNRGILVNPNQQLTRIEALRLYTIGNAWFSFEEQDLGSIEPGKFADLVVLDKDYLNMPEQNIRTLKSVLTIVNGQIVYQDKAVMPEI